MTALFEPDQVRAAIVVADATVGFPLPDTAETKQMLAEAITPALEALPSHHDCEMVRHALMTMFVMGLAVGVELERRS